MRGHHQTVSAMQGLTLPLLVLTVVALGTGCSSLERSRNLANPKVSGTTLAQQVCSNCHGIDGNSVSPNFPNLAAQQKAYLVAQLEGFRKPGRADPAGFQYMWGLSRNLTDKQIGELADYFAAQKVVSPQAGDPLKAAKGKQIFEEGLPAQNIPPCKSCHGEQGEGMEGNGPRIADQHADYIVKQLEVFQRTDQRPEGAVMKVVAHDLTREDMENVAQYLQ
jgi:cbb3-type cytochrome c oxidase subunit III